MSQQDHMFVESVSKSVSLADGHYSIGLSLRNGDIAFPNNRVAEQRTINHEEYKMFMAIILDKGFAVQVSPKEKAKASQSKTVWCIYHTMGCTTLRSTS